MGLVGRLHQPALPLDAPHLRIVPAASLEERDEGIDAPLGLRRSGRSPGLVERAGAGERGHPHGVAARTVEQAVGHVGIHLLYELVDLLPREEVVGEERVRDQHRRVERRLRRGRCVLLVELHEVGHEPALGRLPTERLGMQRLDLLERLLPAGILARGEVADEHRHLDHLLRVGIPHRLRRAVGIEAHALLAAGVVEGLLVRVGGEFVATAEFVHQLLRVVAGRLAAKRGGQHEPRAVLLRERVHGVCIDGLAREPRRRQPAALRDRLRRRQADDDQRGSEPQGETRANHEPGDEAGDETHWPSSSG